MLKQQLSLFQPYFNVEGRSCAGWVYIYIYMTTEKGTDKNSNYWEKMNDTAYRPVHILR